LKDMSRIIGELLLVQLPGVESVIHYRTNLIKEVADTVVSF